MTSPYYTRIHTLTEVDYQEAGIATFPLLKDLPLRAGFSWGKDSQNMSYKTAKKDLLDRIYKMFFAQLHVPRKRVHINPNIPQDQQILEVTPETLGEHDVLSTGANILFTKHVGITLTGLSGDCPYIIVFAKDESGKSIIGIAHAGRIQANLLLPQKAILYLLEHDVSPDSIFVGITPGIAQKNYFVPVAAHLIDDSVWGTHKELKHLEGKPVYFLDIQGFIIEQLLQCGIKPQHIEVYDIDTYEAAEKGEFFSHRYATITHQPEKDGRFLVAASLA